MKMLVQLAARNIGQLTYLLLLVRDCPGHSVWGPNVTVWGPGCAERHAPPRYPGGRRAGLLATPTASGSAAAGRAAPQGAGMRALPVYGRSVAARCRARAWPGQAWGPAPNGA